MEIGLNVVIAGVFVGNVLSFYFIDAIEYVLSQAKRKFKKRSTF
jgi:hypothetical protein